MDITWEDLSLNTSDFFFKNELVDGSMVLLTRTSVETKTLKGQLKVPGQRCWLHFDQMSFVVFVHHFQLCWKRQIEYLAAPFSPISPLSKVNSLSRFNQKRLKWLLSRFWEILSGEFLNFIISNIKKLHNINDNLSYVTYQFYNRIDVFRPYLYRSISRAYWLDTVTIFISSNR